MLGCTGTNTLAYMPRRLVMYKRTFYNIYTRSHCEQNFFYLLILPNKLECYVHGQPKRLSLIIASKSGPLTQVGHLSVAPIQCINLALLANFKLSLPGANTQAYFPHCHGQIKRVLQHWHQESLFQSFFLWHWCSGQITKSGCHWQLKTV
jgi:hypothetical protein